MLWVKIRSCNATSIAGGKAARLISGAVAVMLGLALGVAAYFGGLAGWWPWAVAGVLVAGGAFQIYEGWCGWCVLRAMGIKTPV